MTAGVGVLLVLAAVALAYVAAPLLRADGRDAPRTSHTLSDARELQSRRDMLLASLKDLEDDRASEKVDTEDYEQLHDRLSAEALLVLTELDALEEHREKTLEAERRFSQPAQHHAPRRPGSES